MSHICFSFESAVCLQFGCRFYKKWVIIQLDTICVWQPMTQAKDQASKSILTWNVSNAAIASEGQLAERTLLKYEETTKNFVKSPPPMILNFFFFQFDFMLFYTWRHQKLVKIFLKLGEKCEIFRKVDGRPKSIHTFVLWFRMVTYQELCIYNPVYFDEAKMCFHKSCYNLLYLFCHTLSTHFGLTPT